MAHRLRRRDFLQKVGFGVGALALGARASDLARLPSASAQSGGTITYASGGGIDTLDPNVAVSTFVAQIGLHLVDPLIWQVRAGQFIPGLATAWTVSPDATTYTFTLRNDVKFHDGTPLTAEAVKVTFDRIVDPETRSQTARGYLGPYERSDVINQSTVRIRFKTPYAAFLDAASTPFLGIVSPTALRRYGKDFGSTVFVGTGPYLVRTYRADAEVVTVRNPNYNWAPQIYKHQGAPYIGQVTFRVLSESGVRVGALTTNEVQVIENVPASDYARLKDDRNLVLHALPQAATPWSLMFNHLRPPTNDLAVRKSVMQAVDKEGLIKSVWGGLFKPACAPITPNLLGYDSGTCKKITFSLEQARQTLEQAGWRLGQDGIRAKEGQRLRLDLYFNPRVLNALEMGTFLQANLKQVGIDLVLHNLAFGAYLAEVRAGNHNMNFWFYGSTDPGLLLDTIFHSRNAGGGPNRGNYKNPEMDRLLEQALGEANARRRAEIITRIQNKAIDEAAMVYLAEPVGLYGQVRALSGVWFDWGGNYPSFYDARIS